MADSLHVRVSHRPNQTKLPYGCWVYLVDEGKMPDPNADPVEVLGCLYCDSAQLARLKAALGERATWENEK